MGYLSNHLLDHIQILSLFLDDQQYFTITDLDYEGSMLHIMETTKLLGVAELTHEPKHWSVWSAARWIFEERIKEIIYIENNN